DVMEPIRLRRDAASLGAVRVHQPERPTLVAAFVGAVRDLCTVGREAICADAIGLVRETPRDSPGDWHAPQLNRAGQVTDEVESPRIGGERDACRAARVVDPYERRGHRRRLAWRGGEWEAVDGSALGGGWVVAS